MADLSVYKQHNILYTQEDLSRYRPGGYHPVTLGDTFNDGRYKVYHKLGWGGYSTAWLAHDTRQEKWVALKIMEAAASKECTEVDNSQFLQGVSETGRIVQVLDSFVHEGPNGDHMCIVLELLGPSVGKVMNLYTWDEDDAPSPGLVVRMAEQVLEGLQFMHHAGMAHGDINPGNIAFRSTHVTKATTGQILETLGEPYFEELERLDGKPLGPGLPKYIVEAADWDNWFYEEIEDLCILDLGEAFREGNEPDRLAQPGALQSPETFFLGRFDHTVDLWAAGCMIYAFVFGTHPFWHLGQDEVLVAQMIGFVEALPEEWREQWAIMCDKSKHDESLARTEGIQDAELEKQFSQSTVDPALTVLLPVIKGLMRFRPSDRLSATEALDLLRLNKAGLYHTSV